MIKDYSTSILVNQTPAEVFMAINNARAWWQGEFVGNTDKLNEEFSYKVAMVHYSKQRVVELKPNSKIVWLVTESDLSFVTQHNEWANTKLVFDISEENGKTKIVFTHVGLIPKFECYGACSGAWQGLIEKSLYSYITTGEGVKVF